MASQQVIMGHWPSEELPASHHPLSVTFPPSISYLHYLHSSISYLHYQSPKVAQDTAPVSPMSPVVSLMACLISRPLVTLSTLFRHSGSRCRSMPNLAHQVMWNRFVNVRGRNILCDLHNEHLNKLLKRIITNIGASLTEKLPIEKQVVWREDGTILVRQYDWANYSTKLSTT